MMARTRFETALFNVIAVAVFAPALYAGPANNDDLQQILAFN